MGKLPSCEVRIHFYQKENGQMEFLNNIYFSILNCPPVMCIDPTDENVRDNTAPYSQVIQTAYTKPSLLMGSIKKGQIHEGCLA
jgi:hypothetical protein